MSACPLRPESDRQRSKCDPPLRANRVLMRCSEKAPLFDHPVGAADQWQRHCYPGRLGSLEVDDQLELVSAQPALESSFKILKVDVVTRIAALQSPPMRH